MRLKVIIFSLLLTFTAGFVNAGNTVILSDIAAYLKSSNTSEISRYFSSSVELVILSEEDVYSKVQAEMILKDFLYKHQPSSSKIIHRLNSNPNYRFAVVELITNNGKFRVTFSLKNTGGKFLINEMRFEVDKS